MQLAYSKALVSNKCLILSITQVPAARIRKMVIGQNGDSIRSVGVAAREEIEALLKRPVHLYLNVRVR